jgi:hypothetical protein
MTLSAFAHQPERAQRCRGKLQMCIRGAREANRDYLETRDRRYLDIRREAMRDARYWQLELAGKDGTVAYD